MFTPSGIRHADVRRFGMHLRGIKLAGEINWRLNVDIRRDEAGTAAPVVGRARVFSLARDG
jgi:hypothetical protein